MMNVGFLDYLSHVSSERIKKRYQFCESVKNQKKKNVI